MLPTQHIYQGYLKCKVSHKFFVGSNEWQLFHVQNFDRILEVPQTGFSLFNKLLHKKKVGKWKMSKFNYLLQ